MAGYTDGVAKNLSEQSLTTGLNTINCGEVKEDYSNLFELLEDYSSIVITPEGYQDELESLKNGEMVEFDNFGEIGGFYIGDDNCLYMQSDWMTVFDDLSQGALQYITDSDKNVLGVRLGAAGEHIGSVSVWVDTYNEVITQWGKEYPMSHQDVEALNEMADMFYND